MDPVRAVVVIWRVMLVLFAFLVAIVVALGLPVWIGAV
jgi:hypothetical protein